MGHCLDFCYVQDAQIGLPLLESIQRIVVGAKVLRHRSTASNGLIEHPAERETIDHSGMDAEADDPASILIHVDQDPVSPQRGRFAPEQIDTPETVLQMSNEGQPRGPIRASSGRW